MGLRLHKETQKKINFNTRRLGHPGYQNQEIHQRNKDLPGGNIRFSKNNGDLQGSLSFLPGSLTFLLGSRHFLRVSLTFLRGSLRFLRGSLCFLRGSLVFLLLRITDNWPDIVKSASMTIVPAISGNHLT